MFFEIDENEQMYIPAAFDEIVLFSTNCPKCKILESKLQKKNIAYIKNMSVGTMQYLGFDTVPVLKVQDQYLTFGEAIKWINQQEEVTGEY